MEGNRRNQHYGTQIPINQVIFLIIPVAISSLGLIVSTLSPLTAIHPIFALLPVIVVALTIYTAYSYFTASTTKMKSNVEIGEIWEDEE